MFPHSLLATARLTLDAYKARKSMIVLAESCTGGLISALLTEVPGSSSVVERGFVTYSNAAKSQCLGIDADMITAYGAVSHQIAAAMASGALEKSHADIAVAVTGVAGPAGGSLAKPVGLVHIAATDRHDVTMHRECKFGDIGRSEIRLKTTIAALTMANEMLYP